MNKEKSIEALNTLVEINNDRIEGYETASKETNESDLKAIFSQLIQTSQKCKAVLSTEILKLGGTPTEETKITGKFFRVWMDVKAALTGKNRKAILNSCEFGEDAAVATYIKVLKNNAEDLSLEHLNMINEQCGIIKADHDKIKNLRDTLVES